MTNSHDRVSAKIYEFPARGRFANVGQHQDKPVTSQNLLSPRVARVESGSGWYHDEAIRDAEYARKN